MLQLPVHRDELERPRNTKYCHTHTATAATEAKARAQATDQQAPQVPARRMLQALMWLLQPRKLLLLLKMLLLLLLMPLLQLQLLLLQSPHDTVTAHGPKVPRRQVTDRAMDS
jgi:hypothetical protein